MTLEVAMRNLPCLAAILAAAALVSVPLAAQQTGRISGKVLDISGNPVPNAVVVLKRLDITFVKEIKVDSKGGFIQVGLEPKEYEMTVSAEGYIGVRDTVKIPLNDFIVKNITLMTAEQQIAQAGSESPGRLKASAGDTAYTEAVGLYNEKDYAGAMQKFESAIEHYSESMAAAADDAPGDDIAQFRAKAIELLADSRFEAGKADLGQRSALWLSAEPVLRDAFDKTAPDDKSQGRARLAYQLGEIAKMRGDAALEKKYGDALEKIEGPKAENSYNTAVALYNAGKLAEARPHLKKAIEIDPSFAETYYLLAFCELNGGDMKAAKASFQKYLALAPKGKYAAEVKEYLADL
jgi:tetratricopeptide (TPR) repeat protein